MNDNTNHLIRMSFSLTKAINHYGYEIANAGQLQQVSDLMEERLYDHLQTVLPDVFKEIGLKPRRPN